MPNQDNSAPLAGTMYEDDLPNKVPERPLLTAMLLLEMEDGQHQLTEAGKELAAMMRRHPQEFGVS